MTLKEVAKLAGVSHTTVSLVINNVQGSRVSLATRERVLAAIKKLDYNTNLTARSLASGKTDSIGVFIPYEKPIFQNFTIIELISGIRDVLNQAGLDLVLFSGGKRGWQQRSIAQIARQNRVDGLIIFNTRYSRPQYVNAYIKDLNALNFNFAMLAYYWGRADVNYVGVNYELDAYKAVSHLVGLGHRRIAVMGGTLNSSVTAKVLNGVRRALGDVASLPEPQWICHCDYDYQDAYDQMRAMLQAHPSITAVFSAGYEMTPACLNAAKDLGLQVPGDISIISYVDSDIMPLLNPSISALRMPFYDMGRRAAELVVEHDQQKQKVIFDSELIVRASTATPKGD